MDVNQKYWFILLFIFPMLGFAQKSFDYELKGEIKGLNNDTLIFSFVDKNGVEQKLLSPAKENKFSIKGKASENIPVYAQISKKRNLGSFVFFLEF